jgi:type I restriction enzyme R subunit
MSTVILNEDTLSEKPAIEQLRSLGWECIHGDSLDPELHDDCERASRREVILETRLRRKLKEINAGLIDDSVTKAIRRIQYNPEENLLESNRIFHSCLLSGISIDQDIGARRQKLTVHFIDFKNANRNEFLAVSQFWVRENRIQDRPDIVLFINGIPIGVIECKSPVAKDKGVEDAVKQLIRYQIEITRLFRTNEVVIGCNLFSARYGVIGESPEQYHEWKEQGAAKTSSNMQELLISRLCRKDRLLDIIRNFIVYDYSREQHKRIKKICRYQQYSAVNKIVDRVLEGSGKRGIVWHWQGSGKSLIMLFAAIKLRREEEKLRNPVILIVTDRTKLDGQIKETFENCGFPNPIRADSMQDLYSLLSRGNGCTVTTTVQKFRRRIGKPLSTAENIIVMTDEAHRTQYGSFALNLRKSLPNACLFAFTGTPLEKRDRNTYRHFSPVGERYLDRYDMKQSLADGATLPVKYESRLARLQIVGNSIDELLKSLFPEMSERELARLKRRHATVDSILSAPRRIESVARDIVSHYTERIAPNGFKALIVASDRKTAVMYKNAFDQLIDPNRSAIVMTVTNEDPREWKEKYRLSTAYEERLTGKDVFQDPANPLQFIVVCDKLLTGFDAPILQALYLDQRMKEHTLLQCVARTNRPYARKGFGLVVDYVGVGRELAQALAIFDQEDLNGFLTVDDMRNELVSLEACHGKILGMLSHIRRDQRPQDVIQQCLEALGADEARMEFNALFLEFSRSLDILMPDPVVDRFLDDFKFLGAIREGVRNLYRDDRLSLDNCSRKIERLIHAHIADSGIEQILAPLDINSPAFEEKLSVKGNTRAKACHVEHALRETIDLKVAEDPRFYESLKKQLEETIAEYNRKRKDDAELLKDLLDMKTADRERLEVALAKGLTESEYALYGLLEPIAPAIGGDENRCELAKRIDRSIQESIVVDWIEKEDVQKEMRRKIKDGLRDAGVPPDEIEKAAREFIELARARFGKK